MFLRPNRNLPKSIESIQVLRAVAALLVTIFHLSMKMETVSIHSPVLRCFKAGFGGVDLFFIISGFIITHTNVSKINRPDQLIPFLKKRFGRIYSIYWPIVLIASVLLLWFSEFAPSLKWLSYGFNPLEVVKALILFPTHDSTLPVTWTLSYELYFYVLFSLVIASRYFLIVPIAILVATLVAGFSAFAGHPHLFGFRLHDFLLSPFNLEFCFGIAAYFLTRWYTVRLSPILIGLAAILFFLTGELVDPSEIWLRVWGFGIPATVILLGLTHWELLYRFHYPAWLLKLGDASYILYLIHVPAIMVLTQALMRLNIPQYILFANFLLVGVLIWFSWQMHYRIEKPILRWINTRQTKTIDFNYRAIGTYLYRILPGKQPVAHKILVR